ncbi:hypothetical protein B0H13DRAFT_1885759 [Mycena leptocephala]|nr:hypothetical protein B0H13DRAFT_1885759 [Mycena leptocephala]
MQLHWNWFGIGSLRCLFWAHLLVNPAPVQLCISFNAATLELVQDWQAPLPVPGMVAGESCACTPMSRSELAQDRWPTLPVPARSELAQDWWPTLPVLDTVAVTLELVQDRQPPLPVLGTITGKSCICTPIHKHHRLDAAAGGSIAALWMLLFNAIRFPNSGGSVWILSPNCAILKASNLSTAGL